MDNNVLELVLRWLHIASAVILAGGLLFIRLAVWPHINKLDADRRAEWLDGFRGNWAKWVGITSGILLVTGLYNGVMYIIHDKPVAPYHAYLGLKLLLGLAIFALAAMLAGRSGLAQKLRQNYALWLNVAVGLSLAIILLGGLMRLTPRKGKPAETENGRAAERVAAWPGNENRP